jgi:hypothetical protein
MHTRLYELLYISTTFLQVHTNFLDTAPKNQKKTYLYDLRRQQFIILQWRETNRIARGLYCNGEPPPMTAGITTEFHAGLQGIIIETW